MTPTPLQIHLHNCPLCRLVGLCPRAQFLFEEEIRAVADRVRKWQASQEASEGPELPVQSGQSS